MAIVNISGDQTLRNRYAFELVAKPLFVDEILPQDLIINLEVYRQMRDNDNMQPQYKEKVVNLKYGIFGQYSDTRDGLPDSLSMYYFWYKVVLDYLDNFPQHYKKVNKTWLLQNPTQKSIIRYPRMAGDGHTAGNLYRSNQIVIINEHRGQFQIEGLTLEESLELRYVEAVYIPNSNNWESCFVGIHEDAKNEWKRRVNEIWDELLDIRDETDLRNRLMPIMRSISGIGVAVVEKTIKKIIEEQYFWRPRN